MRSYERVHTAVRGCEVVFHQAALPSVPRSVQDPLTSTEANVTGTLNVLLNARDAGVRRVVFASSSSIYGANPELPKHEEMPVLPLSPYAVCKLAGEGYCRSFARRLRPRLRGAALLQRLRPAPGPDLAVLGRDPELHHRGARRAARPSSTATASSRATSPTSPTSSRRTCWRSRAPASPGASTTSPAASGSASTTCWRRSARCSASTSPPSTSTAAPATSRTRRPTSARPSATSATARPCTCARGCGGRSPRSAPAGGALAADPIGLVTQPGARPAGDRAAQRRRSGAPRRHPQLAARPARLRDAARPRRASGATRRPLAGLRRALPVPAACASRACGRSCVRGTTCGRCARWCGIVRAVRPDIVHTHTAKAGCSAGWPRWRRRPRPLIVHTYHGHVLEGYFGAARSRASTGSPSARSRGCSDCLIGVSEATVADLVRLGIAPPRALPLRAASGSTSTTFARADAGAGAALRQELDAPGDDAARVAIGRLVPIKRIDVALRAVARGARARGARVRLAIVGDGPLRERLEHQARELGLGATVAFIGARGRHRRDRGGGRRRAAQLGQRGHARLADRGRCRGPAGRRDRASAASPEVVTDGDGRLVAAGDWRALGAALAELRAIRRRASDAGRRARGARAHPLRGRPAAGRHRRALRICSRRRERGPPMSARAASTRQAAGRRLVPAPTRDAPARSAVSAALVAGAALLPAVWKVIVVPLPGASLTVGRLLILLAAAVALVVECLRGRSGCRAPDAAGRRAGGRR